MKAFTKFIIRSDVSNRHFQAVGETGFRLCSWRKVTHFDSKEEAQKFIQQAGITWQVSILPVHLTPHLGCTFNPYKK